MKADENILKEARKSVRNYRRDAESEDEEQWKKDHDAAMRCFRLEALLALGLSLFDYFNRLDEAWRKRLFSKGGEFDPDMQRLIDELYRWWYKAAPRILDRLEKMENARFQVQGADEFRSACREVAGILTPDEEFFADERLVKLRDRAVDAHRQGKTEEMGSMTD